MEPQQLPLWPGITPRPAALASDGEPPNLRQCMASFLATRRLKRKTRRRYGWTFKHLIAYFGDALPTSNLDVEAFINAQPTLRPASINALYRDTRALLTWSAKRLGTFDAGAGTDRPHWDRPLPEILSPQQVATLITQAPRRERALFAFALDTGARLSEIAGVRRSDITRRVARDGSTRYDVKLRGSPGDGGDWALKTGERVVPLSATAAEFLIGVGAGDLLWTSTSLKHSLRGTPLSSNGIQLAIRRCTRKLLGREYGPHALRHTFATMFLRKGARIATLQRILGHKKIETTLIYVQLLTEDIAEEHGQYSPIANRP